MAEPDNRMTNQRLEKFFVEYEARTNRALDGEVDIKAIAEAFSDCCINPQLYFIFMSSAH